MSMIAGMSRPQDMKSSGSGVINRGRFLFGVGAEQLSQRRGERQLAPAEVLGDDFPRLTAALVAPRPKLKKTRPPRTAGAVGRDKIVSISSLKYWEILRFLPMRIARVWLVVPQAYFAQAGLVSVSYGDYHTILVRL